MTSKLKITHEQEEALQKFINEPMRNTNSKLAYYIERQNEMPFMHEYISLNDFTPEQFALLLCGWYEVEKSFKEGDWIDWFGSICKVTKAERSTSGRLLIHTDESEGHVYEEECKKATPEEIAQEKERRKWAEIGREPDEFREGDILFDGSIYIKFKSYESNVFAITIDDGDFETRHQLKNLSLVCPVERRFDQ